MPNAIEYLEPSKTWGKSTRNQFEPLIHIVNVTRMVKGNFLERIGRLNGEDRERALLTFLGYATKCFPEEPHTQLPGPDLFATHSTV